MATELKELKIARGQVKAAITRAQRYIQGVGPGAADVYQLKSRREILFGKLREFDEIQNKIEISEESVDHDVEREAFESAYYGLLSDFDRLLRVAETPVRSLSAQSTDTINASRGIRLPKIDLPHFSGEYEDWYPFHDTFNSLIHQNESLVPIQKFQYLKSSLKGEAAKVIQSLELSDVNYLEAWQMLKTRYENKRLIVHTHLKAITDLPAMSKENRNALRHLLDGVLKHTRALKAMGRPVDQWDDWLVHTISAKLDPTTCKEWEGKLSQSSLPSFSQLTDFLSHRCQVLEALSHNCSTSGNSNAGRSSQRQGTSSHVVARPIACQICSGGHYIHQCSKFLQMPIYQRIKEAKAKRLCLNCLRSTSHQANVCTSISCRKCNKRHNTLLHVVPESSGNRSPDTNIEAREATARGPNQVVSNISRDAQASAISQIFLSTAVVDVYTKKGHLISARVLLDSGSQSCFITEHFANRLGLKPRRQDTPVTGINQSIALSHHIISVKFKSRFNNFNRTVDCIVLNSITQNLPLVSLHKNTYQIPRNVQLADPNFCQGSRIDMLIGAEVFFELLCVGQIKASQSHPLLQKSQLGWIVSGSILGKVHSTNCKMVSCNLATQELNDKLAKFWELDRGTSNNTSTKEEAECESVFKTTYKRDDQGRFIVRLPFKLDKLNLLGESRETALKRFYHLERKLERQPSIKGEYSSFMDEYKALNHMRLVPVSDLCSPTKAYYMPHHAVFKQSSLTTKLRVVYDASCKSSSGISLNDVLQVGPTVQQDLVSILARFRTFTYALTGDIEKMYRQVLVDQGETCFQRILWRKTRNEEVKTYELLTVTYGTASASFLATRCLKEIAKLQEESFPIGAAIVNRDFYVDDLLTGANTLTEAAIIRDQVIEILAKAGFVLRKWASNSLQLLQDIPCHHSENTILSLNKDADIKTLGVQWNTAGDVLQYSIPVAAADRVTKRSIVSSVARVFDPLGLIGPVLVPAKIIIQRLWQLAIGWDESIPVDLHIKWLRHESQLTELNILKISRRVIGDEPRYVELHGFSDASEEAYGACVYVVSSYEDGRQCGRLLCGKSRVAPLKNLSLPRLELCGAVLLTKLIFKLIPILNVSFKNIFCWTDSSIVLAWISSPSRNWNTFVANRIGEIQELLPSAQWGHVPTKQNPADVISRGATAAELLSLSIWWEGPTEFFNRDKSINDRIVSIPADNLSERRKVAIVAATAVNDANSLFHKEVFEKFSSYNRLVRVMAYCFRFVHNALRGKHERRVNTLTSCEIMRSKLCLVKICQEDAFPDLRKALCKREPHLMAPFLNLNPFLDDEGIIRVGGRLRHSQLPYRTKHPILLPKSHPLTILIIRYEHKRNLHAGCQATLAAVRSEYWPISGRSTVRKELRKCITCFKVLPISSQPIMGDLPMYRVTPSRVFANTGVDYCGPFHVKEGRRRNAKLSKAYAAIFVCMATKAVHIELVSDMTTDSFLGSLKRFISRRGRPSHIYSDNGSNFVGANRELRELTAAVFRSDGQARICDYLSFEGATWHFIPPRAPHFGGLWEAAVKSAKHHLKRVAGDASLLFEELYTLLVQIEAVLNARPLTPLSSDPSDLRFLTPSHFLIGDSMLATAEPDLTEVPVNRLSRWQYVERLRQHFWRRWSKEYLQHLIQRPKWAKKCERSLQPGDMVLIREDNLPPLQWLLGRVATTIPGADGEIRAATVQTARGTISRPTVKLCVLPIEQ